MNESMNEYGNSQNQELEGLIMGMRPGAQPDSGSWDYRDPVFPPGGGTQGAALFLARLACSPAFPAKHGPLPSWMVRIEGREGMLVSQLFLITSLREWLTQQAALTGIGRLSAEGVGGVRCRGGGHESPAAI